MGDTAGLKALREPGQWSSTKGVYGPQSYLIVDAGELSGGSGKTPVRGNFCICGLNFGNKCSFRDQVSVSREKDEERGHHQQVLFLVGLAGPLYKQSPADSPWELPGGLHNCSVSLGPQHLPTTGYGVDKVQCPLSSVELPVELELAQTEEVPGVGGEGRCGGDPVAQLYGHY
ncbi:hypothetical protein HPG69_019114 [Diceros bicornis minor]|uniref:Uncharacterized protein n=1 Tax=Diceros bicornis minor TaxID=77932 RepID=A0A7J7FH08_DICBM|nr:hypothetical protein HPG69_019114 [Diceros bicornis minor]